MNKMSLFKKKKGFTIIELISVMGVIAVLVFLGTMAYNGYTKQAKFTELRYDTRLLSDACERFYVDTGDYPRLTDTPYTAEQVSAFAAKVYDKKGSIVTLDSSGSYYNIDFSKLSHYVKIKEDYRNFILQNPVGDVYLFEPQSNCRVPDEKAAKAKPTIVMGAVDPVTTLTNITWNYQCNVPVAAVKWNLDGVDYDSAPNGKLSAGTHTIKLSVENKGNWSDEISKTITVLGAKPTAAITMTPNSSITDVTTINWSYSGSTDINGLAITDAEWQLDLNAVTKAPNGTVKTVGTHTMKLRVMNSQGLWSDWVSQTFSVIKYTLISSQTTYKVSGVGSPLSNYNGWDIAFNSRTQDINVTVTAGNFLGSNGSGGSWNTDGVAYIYDSTGKVLLSKTFYGGPDATWNITLPTAATKMRIYTKQACPNNAVQCNVSIAVK